MAALATPALRGGWFGRWRARAFGHAPEQASEVTLRHSRIYILPTRRGLAVIGHARDHGRHLAQLRAGARLRRAFLLCGLVAAALLHTFRNLAGIEVAPAGRWARRSPAAPSRSACSSPAAARERIALSIAAADAPAVVIDVDAEATALTVTPRRPRAPPRAAWRWAA